MLRHVYTGNLGPIPTPWHSAKCTLIAEENMTGSLMVNFTSQALPL